MDYKHETDKFSDLFYHNKSQNHELLSRAPLRDSNSTITVTAANFTQQPLRSSPPPSVRATSPTDTIAIITRSHSSLFIPSDNMIELETLSADPVPTDQDNDTSITVASPTSAQTSPNRDTSSFEMAPSTQPTSIDQQTIASTSIHLTSLYSDDLYSPTEQSFPATVEERERCQSPIYLSSMERLHDPYNPYTQYWISGETRFPDQCYAFDHRLPPLLHEEEVHSGIFTDSEFAQSWKSPPVIILAADIDGFRQQTQYRGIMWRTKLIHSIATFRRGTIISLLGVERDNIKYIVTWSRKNDEGVTLLQVNAIFESGQPVHPFHPDWPTFLLEVPGKCEVPVAPHHCAITILKNMSFLKYIGWKMGWYDPFKHIIHSSHVASV